MDRLTELGHVTEQQVVEAYWAADLLLFPSHWEGFGWPVIEAVACGTPVIASNTPGLVEVSGGRARLFHHDYPGMAGAAEQIMMDAAARAAVVGPGLEWARHFTWERAAKQTAGVYEELLS